MPTKCGLSDFIRGLNVKGQGFKSCTNGWKDKVANHWFITIYPLSFTDKRKAVHLPKDIKCLLGRNRLMLWVMFNLIKVI